MNNNYFIPVIILGLLCLNPVIPGHADGDTKSFIDVHVTTVTRKELHRKLILYGTVVPQQASDLHRAASASVAATTAGPIVAVPAIEGNTVRRDDVLVRLDSRQADAAVQRTMASFKQAKAAFIRQQKLAKLDDTSSRMFEQAEQQLSQAEAALKEAQTRRVLLDIKSPLDGIVLAVYVREGETVMAGDAVVEIQDIGRLSAEVQIPASQLDDLKVGQAASVLVSGKDTQGKVIFISMRINPVTGTAPARVSLPVDSGLYSGQFVQVQVIVEKYSGLVVPVSAVRYQSDGSGIVATVEDNQVKLRSVSLGIEAGDQVVIAGNHIREGMQVVTREAYGLPDNTFVRIIRN